MREGAGGGHAIGASMNRGPAERGDGYRPDIDGLRAVAVTSVVAYHAGVPGFPGGFVGVDVFLVISGFLITRLLILELERTGTIAFLQFYARRVRRLLPAGLLVILATLALAAFALVPIGGEQQRLARSAMAASLFWSNVHFLRVTGGYFDPKADEMPLLHTWSLSVEEQFYLAWPLLLLILYRSARGRSNLALVVLLIAVFTVSFAICLRSTLSGAPHVYSAFYLTHLRAWEFALGGLACVACRAWPAARGGAALALAGAAAIAASVLLYSEATPFPGGYALLPAAGAAAIILGCGARPDSWPGKLLASRGFVAIGLLSYSWYLWHWPLLAIARSYALGERDAARDVAIALVALALAALTYRLVERPIRERRVWPFTTMPGTLGAGVALTLVTIGAAQALYFSARASLRAEGNEFAILHRASLDRNPLRERCHQNPPFNGLRPAAGCAVGGNGGTHHRLVLWGDSHADHLMPLFAGLGSGADWSLVQRSHSACPPLLGAVPIRRGQTLGYCGDFNDAVVRELADTGGKAPVGVILSARWTAYVGRVRNPADNFFELRSKGPAGAGTPLAILGKGLAATLQQLSAQGHKVLVVAPTPEMRYQAPECLARRSLEFCSVSRREIEQARAEIVAALRQAIQPFANVRLWDPIDGLCDALVCRPKAGDEVLYLDDDHLTARGAARLGPHMRDALAWLTAPRDAP